ncbi:hypothetical protein, partial [Alicyclobacillus suci]|uniref:hypothetical protein n=1 Tax=Alicyclobacillus suci TaxID=2816080 RepID=UPI003F6A2CA9
PSLAQELDGARSLLGSAGVDLATDVSGLPERWHEPAAWVVREATTNVLRHSAATLVSVGFADGVLTVTNDGPNAPRTDHAGSGSG